jgi:tetratricopeptide (TPR) repeat protein
MKELYGRLTGAAFLFLISLSQYSFADSIGLLRPPAPGTQVPPQLRPAVDAWNRGAKAEARRELGQLLSREPDLVAAHELQAAFCVSSSDFPCVERALRAAVALDKRPRQAHAALGELLFRKKDYAEARAFLNQALQGDPGNPDLHTLLGRIAVESGQPDEALKHFERVPFTADAEGSAVLLQTAGLLLDKGDIAGAAAKLSKCTGECQTLPGWHLASARLDLSRRDFPNAELHFIALTKTRPDLPEGWLGLGRVRRLRKDFTGAEQAYTQLAFLRGQKTAALYQRALVKLESGDTGQAVQLLTALTNSGEEPEASVVLARVQAGSGQPAAARATLEALVKRYPSYAVGHLSLGMLDFSEKRLEAAQQSLTKSVTLAPSLSDGWLLLSNIASAAHRSREAEDYLRRGIAASPQNAELYLRLGLLLEHENRWTAAAQAYAEVLSRRPGDASAKNNRALMLIRTRTNLPEAEKLLRELSGSQQKPLFTGNLGWALMAQGKTREGVRLLEQALAAAPDNAEHHYFLAAGYRTLGQTARADEHLRKAYKLGLPRAYENQTEARDPSPLIYSCPMDRDIRTALPGTCPRCSMELKANLPAARPYELAVLANPEKPQPGQPVQLEFRVKDPASGKPVTRFEIMHDMLFHLFIVSRNLAYFSHEHPALQADGSFRLMTKLPADGDYTLVSDFYPAEGLPQQLTSRLSCGKPSGPRKPVLFEDLKPKSGPNLSGRLALNPELPEAGQNTRLTFTLNPASGLETYLGAWGHLLAVSENSEHVIHAHPADAGGGRIAFDLTFPAKSLYKIWVQFQREGKVNTLYFTVRAQ